MMKILHVSCSPRGTAAESYRLSQRILGHLRAQHPAALVVDRVLGGAAPTHIGDAHIDDNYARALGGVDLPSVDISDEGSLARSEELIRELESADILVLSTPMHNYTVPAALKGWIDHVVRVWRTFHITPNGKVGTLRDRPVFVAISSGGRISGGAARQPDFLTPYLKVIFATIGLQNVTFFTIEETARGPETLAAARAKAEQALAEYFAPGRGEWRSPLPQGAVQQING